MIIFMSNFSLLDKGFFLNGQIVCSARGWFLSMDLWFLSRQRSSWKQQIYALHYMPALLPLQLATRKPQSWKCLWFLTLNHGRRVLLDLWSTYCFSSIPNVFIYIKIHVLVTMCSWYTTTTLTECRSEVYDFEMPQFYMYFFILNNAWQAGTKSRWNARHTFALFQLIHLL